ncbi:type II toxin-antitoxin system VapC family toxin [Halobaculum sp. MBLA0147]|uniref:type II toxin-antitoxin system VapC family toxin n=1 Tax=Halobaculum sp. MBLA0147 TaxID=3079934 RepID=UPI0035263CE6
MSDGPYLFDVGVTALAHSEAPVREAALSYVRRAVTGDIDAVVPYTSVFGAHNALTAYYGFSNERASRVLQNFLRSRRIHWVEGPTERAVSAGLDRASELNVDGWDGYYAEVAVDHGVETLLTLDDDFERLSGVTAEVILSPEQFAELNDYLGY